MLKLLKDQRWNQRRTIGLLSVGPAATPGGDDEHFGVVHFGTSAGHLSQTAKSHIRLNRGHPDTVFRVMLNNLKPGTIYYYTVGSVGADGTNDQIQSMVQKFTTPGAPAGP